MKILHVIATLAPRDGGPSAVLPEMCRSLTERGHDVEIVTTNRDGAGELDVPVATPILNEGVKTTYYPAQRPRSYGTSLPMAMMLRKRLAEFDVVHVHSLYLFHTAIAGVLCRRRAVPYIIRPHGTLDPYHRSIHRWRKAIYGKLMERRNLSGAAAIHYTSTREQVFAEEAGVRTPGYVIPHGIDLQVFDDTRDVSLVPPLPDSEGRILITFLGRLTEKKGLDVLCDAFAQICDAEPQVHLVIAGPDEEGLGLRISRWVDERRLTDRVSLPGLITGPVKVELLRRSSVFVLPSRDENFGVTVAEALASRTPVIVTKGVAIHEEIEHANAGLIVNRTPEAVANALLHLLGDEQLRVRLARNGRALVERSYSWNRVAVQLEQMYRAVVATQASCGVSAGRRPRSR
jgi:glycosyltransferase involved in cell wall biosynthesis